MSRLLVLGAAGATGRHVVHHAIAAGHAVTALARDPSRVPALPGVRAVAGDATDPAALAAAVAGHDAVICALGAPGRDRSQCRTRGTRAAIAAMQAAGVPRLVVLSSYGVGDSRAKLPLWIRYGLVPLFLGPGFADHEAQEALVRASGLSACIVRPPFLTDDPGGTRVVVADDLAGTAMKIPRADVARVLVDAAADTTPACRVLAVASA